MRVPFSRWEGPARDVHADALPAGVKGTRGGGVLRVRPPAAPVFTETPLSPPAFNTARCERLRKEKEELERRFEDEVRRLGWQQQAELQDLQERLRLQFQAEVTRLQEEHGAQLLRVRRQHREQVGGAGAPGGPSAGWEVLGRPRFSLLWPAPLQPPWHPSLVFPPRMRAL